MRISSRYTSDDWRGIRRQLPDDGSISPDTPGQWDIAIDVMRDRLETRFLRAARVLVNEESSGFVLLLVDSILIEYLERLRTDGLDDNGASRDLVTNFLRERQRFRSAFGGGTHDLERRDCPCLACDFYRSARSGVAHFGETRNDWLIRFGRGEMLGSENGARVLDRNRFHRALEDELNAYYRDLAVPSNAHFRRILKDALDVVCGVRAPQLRRRARRNTAVETPAAQ